MNITMFDMYVFGCIDNVICTMIVVGFILTLAGFCAWICKCNDNIENWSTVFLIFISAFLLFFVAMFIPSQKTIAMMYVVPKIANSEFINKELPNDVKDVYVLAVEKLKESIKSNK